MAEPESHPPESHPPESHRPQTNEPGSAEPESGWAAAREKITQIFERFIVLDPFVLGAPKSSEKELARRADWVDRISSGLRAAPNPEAARPLFVQADVELREHFSSDLSGAEGRFANAAKTALDGALGLALHPAPWPAPSIGEVDLPQDSAALPLLGRAAARLGSFSKLAQSGAQRLEREGLIGLATLAGFSAARLALGLPIVDALAAARRLGALAREPKAPEAGSPEERLGLAQSALCERFGYAGVEIENDRHLGAEARLRLTRAMGRQLAQAAKDLGVAERGMGFDGLWTLRIIDGPAHKNPFGRAAYVQTSARCLAASVSSGAVEDIGHEWTHALDVELFYRAKTAARALGAAGAPFWGDERPFFSLLPSEAQDVLPLAKEGYLRLAGAGQNVDGAAGFEALAKQAREEASLVGDRIVAMMLSGLSDRPGGGMESLSEAESEALRGGVRGAIKHLATSPGATRHAIGLASAARRSLPSLAQILLEAPEDSSERVALGVIAEAFTRQWGSSWIQTPRASASKPSSALGPKSLVDERSEAEGGGPGAPSERALAAVARSFADAAERNAPALARVGWSQGSGLHALNPDNDFAKTSKLASVAGLGPPAYWDAAHEMLARSAARPRSLRQRLSALGETPAFIAPEMGSEQQRWLAQGWAQLTEAAGLRPAQRAFGARDAIEAVFVDATRAPRIVAAANALVSAASATEDAVEALLNAPQKALGAARSRLASFRQGKALSGAERPQAIKSDSSASSAQSEARAPGPGPDDISVSMTPPASVLKNLAARRALSDPGPSPPKGPSPLA